jgi:hypothetical protein
MSWKVEVIADASGTWAGNAWRFASREDAVDHAIDLEARWVLVRCWRVVPSEDPVSQP